MSRETLTKVQQSTPTINPLSRGSILQRTCAACSQHTIAGGVCSECQNKPSLLQRSASNQAEISEVPPIVTEVLKSSGQPLDQDTRTFMESRFGHDFSSVRLHTNTKAAQSAQAVQAHAFTVGQDVVFGTGQYAPSTTQGKKLIAHELAHTVQQSSSAQSIQGKLKISHPGDTAEKEADLVANQVTQEQPVTSNLPRSSQPRLQRQAVAEPITAPVSTPTRTIDGSAASISWIHPSSPAGSMPAVGVPDPAPPATVTEGFLTGSSGFRFSNYLHGYVATNDSRTISGSGLYSNSGIYTSPSQFGIASQRFNTLRNQRNITNSSGIQGVEFQQLVGARTVSAGVAGGAVGAGVGVLGGAWLGAKAGGAGGTLVTPGIGTAIGAIGGAILGGIGGYFAGTRTANAVTNFPPIWTEIKLTLMADGTKDCQLLRHSLFPSNHLYCDLLKRSDYIALATEQTAWENSGWGGGNPWGMNRPTFSP